MEPLYRSWVWIFVFAIALFLWVWPNWFGLGCTSDSLHYMAAARYLRSQQYLLDYDGMPFVQWLPLYPVLLAFFVGLPKGIWLFHFLMWIGFFCLLWKYFQTHPLGWLATAALVGHPQILTCFSFVWSEAIGLPLLLVACHMFEANEKSIEPRWSWLMVGLLVALALTRYAFLPLVAIMVVVYSWGEHHANKKNIYLRAGMLAYLAFLGYIAIHYIWDKHAAVHAIRPFLLFSGEAWWQQSHSIEAWYATLFANLMAIGHLLLPAVWLSDWLLALLGLVMFLLIWWLAFVSGSRSWKVVAFYVSFLLLLGASSDFHESQRHMSVCWLLMVWAYISSKPQPKVANNKLYTLLFLLLVSFFGARSLKNAFFFRANRHINCQEAFLIQSAIHRSPLLQATTDTP